MSKNMTRLVEEEDTVYTVDLSCMQKRRKRKRPRGASGNGKRKNVRSYDA